MGINLNYSPLLPLCLVFPGTNQPNIKDSKIIRSLLGHPNVGGAG